MNRNAIAWCFVVLFLGAMFHAGRASAANYCSWGMPAAWVSGGGTSANWATSGATYGGIRSITNLKNSVGSATTTPFTFDADEYGIVCTSFPNAGGAPDPLISQAAAISALQSQATGLQQQIDTVQTFSSLDPADLGVTPLSVGKVWGWGVGVVLFLFMLGMAGGSALKAIREL